MEITNIKSVKMSKSFDEITKDLADLKLAINNDKSSDLSADNNSTHYLDYLTSPDCFNVLANRFLNKMVLYVNSKKFRLVEIEFYLHTKEHSDSYAHQDPDQLVYGWYFHKKGNSYKSGTFKGLDIAMGQNRGPENLRYFGILIRSIQDLETGNVTEGPCLSVNKFLEVAEVKSIAEFVETKKELELKSEELKTEEIFIGPRIGLNKDKYPEWLNKEYRYLIYKDKIKKQKRSLHKL